MSTYEALSLMHSESVDSVELDEASLQIDCQDMDPHLFYTTCDGKKSLSLTVYRHA